MKWRNVILLICLFATQQVIAQQSAYYDALFLSDSCLNDEGKFKNQATVYKILSKYFNHPIKDDSIKKNPILAPYVPDLWSSTASGSKFKDAITSIGKLNVTSFADGLAKFLVARAKEELNVAFFQRFKEFMNKYPEAKTIFPNTFGFLDKIYAYQYNAMLPALRTSFQLDLNQFNESFLKLRDLNVSDCTHASPAGCVYRISTMHNFLNNQLAGRAVTAALLTSRAIMKGNNAAQILQNITDDRLCTNHNDNLSNIFHFANLISISLRSKEENEIWIDNEKLNELLSKTHAFTIYLGLLYAQDKMRPVNIVFRISGNTTVSLQQLLVKASKVDSVKREWRESLIEFTSAGQEVSGIANKIISSPQSSQSSNLLLYADYATAISTLLKEAVTFLDTSKSKLGEDVIFFTGVIDDAVNSCYDIKSQNYGALILHTSQILKRILKEQYTFEEEYIKYGTFMAGIVDAENSDEVKAAIEAVVLPVGSASIKRETEFNVSLNSYIGPMVGMEYMAAQKTDQWATVLGVTAPVGVAFSWGQYGNGKRNDPPVLKNNKHGNPRGGQSWSLFVPLIDVGALATFRMSDDSTDVAADILLENIIAPGLYLYYGFAKVPISLGVGGQIGPQLREVNTEQINVDKNFYLRFGLNLTVDIPFFNFYTKN